MEKPGSLTLITKDFMNLDPLMRQVIIEELIKSMYEKGDILETGYQEFIEVLLDIMSEGNNTPTVANTP